MKATELRIGNWVKRDDQPDGFQIDSRSFIVCERDPEMYQPIPLTEEWLVKFGFDSLPYTDQYEYNGMLFNLDLTKGTFDFWCDNVTGRINYIHFVHQLQNLYFALTGQELEIIQNSNT
jgi:hypothetical protein